MSIQNIIDFLRGFFWIFGVCTGKKNSNFCDWIKREGDFFTFFKELVCFRIIGAISWISQLFIDGCLPRKRKSSVFISSLGLFFFIFFNLNKLSSSKSSTSKDFLSKSARFPEYIKLLLSAKSRNTGFETGRDSVLESAFWSLRIWSYKNWFFLWTFPILCVRRLITFSWSTIF